jgi:hypothetical protein
MAAPADRDWIYVIDTSSWLSIEGHPAQNRILSALVPLIEMGRIPFPPQVWDEFKETSDLVSWLEPYRDRCVERRSTDPSFLATVGQIAHEFAGMSGTRGRRERADPWVVATALHSREDGKRWLVVCNESAVKRPNRRITGACARYKILCMSLLEMLDQE